MVMSVTEQNNLNQALNTAKTGTFVLIQTRAGTQRYVLVRSTPLQPMTATQLAAYASYFGVTVASP